MDYYNAGQDLYHSHEGKIRRAPMNWSKAKTILIIIFAAMNIFLLINLIKIYSNDETALNITNTEKILKDRGYILNCDIPGNIHSGMLNFETGDFDRRKIGEKLLGVKISADGELGDGFEYTSGDRSLKFQPGNVIIYNDKNPSDNVDIYDIRKIRKYAESFIKDLDIPANQYFAEKYNSDGSITLYYKQKYKGFLIFYNEAEVTITEKGITGFRCKFIKPLGIAAAKKIVPAYQILLKHFDGGDNTVITSIDAGFVGSFHQSSVQASEALVWRIGIDGQKPLYFNAVNAEKIDIEGMFSD